MYCLSGKSVLTVFSLSAYFSSMNSVDAFPPAILSNYPTCTGAYAAQVGDQVTHDLRDRFGIIRYPMQLDNWENYQTTQKSDANSVAEDAQNRGDYVIFVCGFGGDKPATSTTDYISFVADLAGYLHGKGYDNVIYELGNEDNCDPYFKDPKLYYNMANSTAAAIHSQNPNAIICTAGISTPFNTTSGQGPVPWSTTVIQNIDWTKVDFFGFHAYSLDRGTGNSYDHMPEIFDSNNDLLDASIISMRTLLHKYSSTADLIMTERGWDHTLNEFWP